MPAGSWNDKNLDYEIETSLRNLRGAGGMTWNDKNLDYEIETENALDLLDFLGTLETTRTSITRLKPVTHFYNIITT